MYNISDQNCEDIQDDANSGLSEYHYTRTNNESIYALVIARKGGFNTDPAL